MGTCRCAGGYILRRFRGRYELYRLVALRADPPARDSQYVGNGRQFTWRYRGRAHRHEFRRPGSRLRPRARAEHPDARSSAPEPDAGRR